MSARLLLVFVSACGFAAATPLCTDQSSSGVGSKYLSSYISAGTCQAGDYIFSFAPDSYQYSTSGVGSGQNVLSSQVVVQVMEFGDEVLLSFQGPWGVNRTQTADLTIRYTVSTMYAPIGGASNMFNGFAQGAASVDQSSTCGDAIHPCLPELALTNSYPGMVQMAPAFGPIYMTDSAHLSATGGTANDTVHLSLVQDAFLELPEPSTFLAIGSGLVALGWLRKRK